MQHAILATTSALVLVASAANAHAAEDPVRVSIAIRGNRFEPAELHVPANKPCIIEVHNEDATAEEFESAELGVEKVVAGGRSLPVRVRALPPGRYRFIGEYHQDTAAGVLIVDGAN